jgi:hypothetical protein
MHSRDIAVTEEDLWIPANQVVVDAGEKLPGSVSSANADDGLHLGILEHRVKIVQTLLDGCDASFPVGSRILAPFRFQSEIFDGSLRKLEPVRVGHLRRRTDDSYRITRSQGARLNEIVVRRRSRSQHGCCRYGRQR